MAPKRKYHEIDEDAVVGEENSEDQLPSEGFSPEEDAIPVAPSEDLAPKASASIISLEEKDEASPSGLDAATLVNAVIGPAFMPCASKAPETGSSILPFEELVPIARRVMEKKRKISSHGPISDGSGPDLSRFRPSLQSIRQSWSGYPENQSASTNSKAAQIILGGKFFEA